MLPDRVSNPGPLTYESGALPIALRGPAGGHNKERQQHEAVYISIFVLKTNHIKIVITSVMVWPYLYNDWCCMKRDLMPHVHRKVTNQSAGQSSHLETNEQSAQTHLLI